MKIRLMTPFDYEQAYVLWLSCAGMGLNDIDDSQAGIHRFLDRNPETWFVAEENGVVVGAILAGNDGRRGYIYHTAVSPAFRKQGIGRQLVESVMNAFDQIGVTKTALVVFSKNGGGNAFWEKLGFTQREDLIYRNKAITEMNRIDT